MLLDVWLVNKVMKRVSTKPALLCAPVWYTQSDLLYLEVANKLQREPQAFKPHHVRMMQWSRLSMLHF
jgi:hypothetical protein